LKRHPEFLASLRSGELCLSNLDLVARKAEDEALRRDISKREAEKALLGEAKGKSKRAFQKHIRELEPPAVPLLPEMSQSKSRSIRLDEETLNLLSEFGIEFGESDEGEVIKLCLKKVLAQKRIQGKEKLVSSSTSGLIRNTNRS